MDAGLKPGFVVAGFEILGELGRGSNGIVLPGPRSNWTVK